MEKLSVDQWLPLAQSFLTFQRLFLRTAYVFLCSWISFYLNLRRLTYVLRVRISICKKFFVALLDRNNELAVIKNDMIKLLNFGFVEIDTIEHILSLFFFTVDIRFKLWSKIQERYFANNQVKDLHEYLAQGERRFDQDVKIFIHDSLGLLFFSKFNFRINYLNKLWNENAFFVDCVESLFM